MGWLTSTFSFLTFFVLLSSCGGSGGGASSPSSKSSSSNSSSNSSSSSSQPVVIVDPLWKDAGALGSNILLLSGDEVGSRQYIQKIDTSGVVTTLTPSFVKDGSVALVSLSPDGKKIAYIADQEVDEIFELFIVNTDGSFSRKISHNLSSANFVAWSPDSNYMIYTETGTSGSKYFIKKYNAEIGSEIVYGATEGNYITLDAKFNGESNEYTYLTSNNSDSHLITVNILTGIIKKNILISKVFGRWTFISPSGRYLKQSSEIYDTETNQIYYPLIDQTSWWLFNEDKILSWDLPQAVSIYDPTQNINTQILDASNINHSAFSGKNWAPLQKYVFLLFGEITAFDEIYVFSLENQTTLRLKEVLGTNEKILSYQVAPTHKLLAFTGAKDLYTFNLDGTAVQHFDYLKSLENVSNVMWSSGESEVVFTAHDSDNNGGYFSIKKLNLSNGSIASFPLPKTPACLIVTSSSPTTCGDLFLLR